MLITIAASGGRFLEFSDDYRIFFSKENPQLQAFEDMQNVYSKTDNVLFVLTPREGQVFTRETLQAVTELTEACWQIPYSLRVDSITNFQHTYAEEDDLVVEDLVLEPASLTEADLQRIRQIATSEPLLLNRLISPDGYVTGVNVTVQLPGKRPDEVPEVAAFVRNMAVELEAVHPGVEVRLTGMVMMNNAFPESSRRDMQVLYPLMFVSIVLMLALLLKSIPGTLTTTLVILLTIIGIMGLSGWAGVKLSAPSVGVPIIVMTLAVADCVHILVNFLHGMRNGLSRTEAMLESLRVNLGPVFLTTLTTAIGFLSLNFSDAPPFRDLGNMAAGGVVIAFVLAILFLPAMMMILPIKALRNDTVGSKTMTALANFVIRWRKPLFWGMGLLILLLVVQLPRNQLNDEFVKYFDHSIAFRADTDYTNEHLTGIYWIDYSVGSKGEDGVSDPEYLRHLDAFANWLRAQPYVLHVNAMTDIMKRLNKNMHGDDPAWYKLPDKKDLAAQYLLLYELSMPFGLDLNNQINVKRSATRITVTMDSISTKQLLNFEERAKAWLIENTPEYMWAEGASPSVMFSHIGERNIHSMLKGTSVALVLISLILVVALRSWRIGLISLLPNLAPMSMAFGLWAILDGQVGLALSVVTGMTLGIVVDDTVHFLSKYLRARREQGLNDIESVRYAFSTVGTALWVTSLVLVVGFLVLTFSDFQLNARLGLLTSITIAFALVADFLFLPPLLMKFGGSGANTETTDNHS
ncbi:MAG: efflux RND transporter permease subunit [Candidatus Thiodiazotropha sp.]